MGEAILIYGKSGSGKSRSLCNFGEDEILFVNTINKAVETMQAAGISADSKKIQNEDYIEYRVRIPIQKKAVQ